MGDASFFCGSQKPCQPLHRPLPLLPLTPKSPREREKNRWEVGGGGWEVVLGGVVCATTLSFTIHSISLTTLTNLREKTIGRKFTIFYNGIDEMLGSELCVYFTGVMDVIINNRSLPSMTIGTGSCVHTCDSCAFDNPAVKSSKESVRVSTDSNSSICVE